MRVRPNIKALKAKFLLSFDIPNFDIRGFDTESLSHQNCWSKHEDGQIQWLALIYSDALPCLMALILFAFAFLFAIRKFNNHCCG